MQYMYAMIDVSDTRREGYYKLRTLYARDIKCEGHYKGITAFVTHGVSDVAIVRLLFSFPDVFLLLATVNVFFYLLRGDKAARHCHPTLPGRQRNSTVVLTLRF